MPNHLHAWASQWAKVEVETDMARNCLGPCHKSTGFDDDDDDDEGQACDHTFTWLRKLKRTDKCKNWIKLKYWKHLRLIRQSKYKNSLSDSFNSSSFLLMLSISKEPGFQAATGLVSQTQKKRWVGSSCPCPWVPSTDFLMYRLSASDSDSIC